LFHSSRLCQSQTGMTHPQSRREEQGFNLATIFLLKSCLKDYSRNIVARYNQIWMIAPSALRLHTLFYQKKNFRLLTAENLRIVQVIYSSAINLWLHIIHFCPDDFALHAKSRWRYHCVHWWKPLYLSLFYKSGQNFTIRETPPILLYFIPSRWSPIFFCVHLSCWLYC
jgi:hypothetical protein